MIGAAAFADGWQSWNPGGGGAIQALSCHPGIPGRMYECSDEEGSYRSDDYGQSWQWIGRNLNCGFDLALTGEPGNGNRLYSGSLRGLSVSDDGGAHWTFAADIPDLTPIDVITVDYYDHRSIYAGPGWLDRDYLLLPGQSATGPQAIYVSHDQGAHWTRSVFNAASDYQAVSTISVSQVNNQVVYVGARSGLYVSGDAGGSWTHIAAPSGTDGRCFGADLAPNGGWIVASFEISAGRNHLFAAPVGTNGSTSSPAWVDISSGLTDPSPYWRPQINGTAYNGNAFQILVAHDTASATSPLYQGTFTASGGSISGSFSEAFNDTYHNPNLSFDMGWNFAAASVKIATYTPADWGGAGQNHILLCSQETGYYGDANNLQTSWIPVTTASAGGGAYRSRGIASTFDWDIAADGSYVMQGQADNGCLESYDGGQSWRETYLGGNPNTDSTEVIPYGTALAVAGATYAYGGGSVTDGGTLYAKWLVHRDTSDTWFAVAGGSGNGNGLPNARIWSIADSPQNPSRVYCGTQQGLFVTDDFGGMASGSTGSPFRNIGAGGPGNTHVDRVGVDPSDAGTVFCQAGNGTWRGVRQGDGSYTWTQMSSVASDAGSGALSVWRSSGHLEVATLDSGNVLLSQDGGAFGSILTLSQAIGLHGEAWYTPSVGLSFFGLVGSGSNVFVGLASPYSDHQKGYGFLQGSLDASGGASWTDWTEGAGGGYFAFPLSRRGKILVVNGQSYVGQATGGAGLWVRPVGETTGPTAPVTDLQAQ